MNDRFPKIEAKALSGKKIVLPDDTLGKVSFIGIAFQRGAQGMLDSWIDHFERMCGGESIYEIPMIDGMFWKVMSGFIDEGMKAGIPEEKHDNVATFYGSTFDIRKKLNMDDKSLGYVFLLDEEGKIIWRERGYANEEGLEELQDVIKSNC